MSEEKVKVLQYHDAQRLQEELNTLVDKLYVYEITQSSIVYEDEIWVTVIIRYRENDEE